MNDMRMGRPYGSQHGMVVQVKVYWFNKVDIPCIMSIGSMPQSLAKHLNNLSQLLRFFLNCQVGLMEKVRDCVS